MEFFAKNTRNISLNPSILLIIYTKYDKILYNTHTNSIGQAVYTQTE